MPKRVGHLYEKMLDREFIRQSIVDAARHKHKRREVAAVLSRIDDKVEEMYVLLTGDDYLPAKPKSKRIWDRSSRKERVITYVPFWPDSVIHMMLVKAMQPVMMRGMYRWSCASLPGRGGNAAKTYLTRAIRGDPKHTKYVLKMDIRQFYPSIDHIVLLKLLFRKIKDVPFLTLLWRIISTCKTGLAIGFHTNQWLANFYLEPLDRLICALPGVSYYVRYMDDMVVMGPNKRALHKARKAISAFLNENLQLELKNDWQVWPLAKRDIDFVGFRFFRDHTTLRRRTSLRLMRQCRRVRKKQHRRQPISYRMAAGFISRVGQSKHFDSAAFRRQYFKGIRIKKLKEVIRHESKIRRPSAIAGARNIPQATGAHSGSLAGKYRALC